MRALLCLAFVSSTLFVSSSLAAVPMDSGDEADLKYAVAGLYRLPSGLDVRLRLVDQQLYVDLNRYYRKQVFPVSENLLSSRDGDLTVQYLPEGPVERIVIQHARFPVSQRLGERSWLGK
ncbi:MAG: hypothetical protein AB1807_23370 [Pseudomonadota bacterium]